MARIQVQQPKGRDIVSLYTAFRRAYWAATDGAQERSKGIHVPYAKVKGPSGSFSFPQVIAANAQLLGSTVAPTCGQCPRGPVVERGGRTYQPIVAHHGCAAQVLEQAATAGLLVVQPCKGGRMVYLADEAPERSDNSPRAASDWLGSL